MYADRRDPRRPGRSGRSPSRTPSLRSGWPRPPDPAVRAVDRPPRSRATAKPNDDRAAERPARASVRGRNKATRPSDDDDVEEVARVSPASRRSSSRTLIRIAPSTTPAWLPCAAEDDHRVDGDQEREVEVEREDAAVRATRTNVPVSAATAAPKAKLISFSQFTGMPITSAASGSSRSERHARPVREWLRKRSATNTTAKNPSATK